MLIIGARGENIMTDRSIIHDGSVGDGSLISLNCTLGHDTHMDDYCELFPGTHISGNRTLGKFCSIGTGTVILTKVTLDDKDIADNTTVVSVLVKPLEI